RVMAVIFGGAVFPLSPRVLALGLAFSVVFFLVGGVVLFVPTSFGGGFSSPPTFLRQPPPLETKPTHPPRTRNAPKKPQKELKPLHPPPLSIAWG
ncbi:hypothetical protein ACC732_36235, partial [Rhizobium ruizarguesonis]